MDYLGWVLQDVKTYEFKEPHGNRIFVPKVVGENQCWNHPIPCTPYFDTAALEKVRWPETLPPPPRDWKPDIPPPGVWKDVEGHH
jgi:hypothetical protein